jgi:preprotein translocase subunit YajC
MDATQILLISVITVLTILLVVIGIQVFLILKEVQQSIKKANKMLDDAGTISGSIASLSDKFSGISGIAGFLNWLVNRKKKKEESSE